MGDKPNDTDNIKQSIVIPNAYHDEIFLPINILNIREYYYISNYGRIYSVCKEKFLSQFKEDSGYLLVSLPMKNTRNYKRIRVHRLLMLVFCYHEGCEELVVNHKDGVKDHNWLWNLEWSTQKENNRHAWELGLATPHPCIGEDNGRAKLNNKLVEEICERLSRGETAVSISKRYNISRAVVTGIKNGTNWTHISQNYNFSNANHRDLDKDIVKDICARLQKCETPKQIANTLNISESTIRGIKERRTYKNISKDYSFPRYSRTGKIIEWK